MNDSTLKQSFKSPFSVLGIILGVSLILAVFVGASTFYKIRSMENTLSVTGSAKKEIDADQVRWIAVFTRNVTATTLKEGYRQMAADLTSVKAFYKDNGLSEDQFTVSAVFMDQIYDYGNNQAEKEVRYTLRQTVELNSTDVQKITNLAKNTSPLIEKGVLFATQGLEYYYSKLPDLRVSLLSDALNDAKARAAVLAKSSGKKVGTLKSATSGVVQVLPQKSVEVSDYGAYDTSSIKKQVMVTTKATFTLK